MNDIDFDELDRAVNKIVGGGDNRADSSADISRPNASESNTVQIASPTSVADSDKAESSPVPGLPKRRSGRFMDVMHPSSDMKVDNEDSTEPKPSQQDPSLAVRKPMKPINQDIVAAKPDIVKEQDNTRPPSEDVLGGSLHSDWPDPLDMPHNKPENTPADTSLFLPDAKVEKRPLGGFPEAARKETAPALKLDDERVTDSSEATTQEEQQKVELPPELEKDLVAIEAGEALPEEAVKETPEESHEDDDDWLDEEEETSATTTPPVSKEETKPPQASDEHLSGLLASGSIPQQYKTAIAPSPDKESSHPLFFDADHYEKAPVTVSPKHKSGTTTLFQWVFIVIGLLLLGASLGAALFVFVSS